jgi:hypothetical protein
LAEQQALEQDQWIIPLWANPRSPRAALQDLQNDSQSINTSILAKASSAPTRSIASHKKKYVKMPQKLSRNFIKIHKRWASNFYAEVL